MAPINFNPSVVMYSLISAAASSKKVSALAKTAGVNSPNPVLQVSCNSPAVNTLDISFDAVADYNGNTATIQKYQIIAVPKSWLGSKYTSMTALIQDIDAGNIDAGNTAGTWGQYVPANATIQANRGNYDETYTGVPAGDWIVMVRAQNATDWSTIYYNPSDSGDSVYGADASELLTVANQTLQQLDPVVLNTASAVAVPNGNNATFTYTIITNPNAGGIVPYYKVDLVNTNRYASAQDLRYAITNGVVVTPDASSDWVTSSGTISFFTKAAAGDYYAVVYGMGTDSLNTYTLISPLVPASIKTVTLQTPLVAAPALVTGTVGTTEFSTDATMANPISPNTNWVGIDIIRRSTWNKAGDSLTVHGDTVTNLSRLDYINSHLSTEAVPHDSTNFSNFTSDQVINYNFPFSYLHSQKMDKDTVLLVARDRNATGTYSNVVISPEYVLPDMSSVSVPPVAPASVSGVVDTAHAELSTTTTMANPISSNTNWVGIDIIRRSTWNKAGDSLTAHGDTVTNLSRLDYINSHLSTEAVPHDSTNFSYFTDGQVLNYNFPFSYLHSQKMDKDTVLLVARDRNAVGTYSDVVISPEYVLPDMSSANANKPGVFDTFDVITSAFYKGENVWQMYVSTNVGPEDLKVNMYNLAGTLVRTIEGRWTLTPTNRQIGGKQVKLASMQWDQNLPGSAYYYVVIAGKQAVKKGLVMISWVTRGTKK